MDIHKPKAAHSWREFAIEIATIVTGILIALGLEQAVEQLHERRAALEAHESVRAEIANNLAVLVWRQSEQACIDRRLDEIDALLERARTGAEIKPAAYLGRPVTGPINTFRLQAASQAGRTSLFTNDEQAVFALIYFPLGVVLDLQRMEQVTWAHLQGVVGFKTLSPDMVLSLSQSLSEARYENDRTKLATTRAFEQAANLQIKPMKIVQKENVANMHPVCLPMNTRPPGT